MSLNAKIDDTNPTDLYVEWDKDPAADGYVLIAPSGSRVQVGKRANTDTAVGRVHLGNPTQPFTVKVAAAYAAPFESVTYPPPPPPAGLPRYGGATGFEILKGNTATINSELDKWKDVGCQILRTDLADSPQWIGQFKLVRDGAAARGIKIGCSLRGTSGPIGTAGAADFAKRMATMFGNTVAFYEYVNEPNLGGPRYQPAAYGPELAAVYAAIKAVDSNLPVATCGMGWDGAGKFSNWWPAAYNSGGKDHFDLFNVHLYGDPTSAPWTEAFQVYAQYGQGKPVISTESGTSQASAQATVIPRALHDTRAHSVFIYNMMPEVAGYNMFGNPGYAAYKNTPKT